MYKRSPQAETATISKATTENWKYPNLHKAKSLLQDKKDIREQKKKVQRRAVKKLGLLEAVN